MTSSFEIPGHRAEFVPNTFIPSESPSNRLAILFPGQGYTCDMPIFYYSETLLAENGFDVLRIDAHYWKDKRLVGAPLPDRIRWIMDDVAGAIRAGLGHRRYDELVIMTKSISTAALVNLLSSGFSISPSPKLVWLAPLIGIEEQRACLAQIDVPGLVVIGTGDPQYDESVRTELSHLAWCVVKDADHSMDIRHTGRYAGLDEIP